MLTARLDYRTLSFRVPLFRSSRLSLYHFIYYYYYLLSYLLPFPTPPIHLGVQKDG